MFQHDEVIHKTKEFVKASLSDSESGHDWWHAYRIWKLSTLIAHKENFRGDFLAVELSALLHDIADAKFNDGDEGLGAEIAQEFLRPLKISPSTIEQVLFVIKHISYRKGVRLSKERTEVLNIVQDADRLDALGAIGIARAFSYGGYKRRAMYDPDCSPNIGMSSEEYRKNNGPTMNHFFEKLFLLKGLMNTKTGRALAEQRHQFMVQFADQFYSEWNVEI